MKKMATVLMFLLTCLLVNAQITITNATFPAEGDTLYTAADVSVSGLSLESAGGNQIWDWSSLSSTNVTTSIFKDASLGSEAASFPNADIFSELALNRERYFQVSANEVLELGFTDFDPITGSFEVTVKYETPYVFARAPLSYNDQFSSKTRLISSFLFDSIPEEITKDLPIKPDSIRVRIEIEREDTVDAWGTMTIPLGTFDVLREKRTQYRNTRVDAYVGILGWSDVTDAIIGVLPDPSLIAPDTTIQYNFLSNMSKEPIAVAIEDSVGAVAQVVYKVDKNATSIFNRFQTRADITLSPNPTYGKTTLFYSAIDGGEYDFVVYDIIGNEIWRKTMNLEKSGRVKHDLSFLQKGTYIYSLVDDEGVNLSSKRLVIINP